MGDVPSEWVEKAESALNEATCVHRERGFAITCPPCDARAVLVAVLPDVRRAVAEEIAADLEFKGKATDRYGDHDYYRAARIAREHASPDRAGDTGDTP